MVVVFVLCVKYGGWWLLCWLCWLECIVIFCWCWKLGVVILNWLSCWFCVRSWSWICCCCCVKLCCCVLLRCKVLVVRLNWGCGCKCLWVKEVGYEYVVFFVYLFWVDWGWFFVFFGWWVLLFLFWWCLCFVGGWLFCFFVVLFGFYWRVYLYLVVWFYVGG